MIEWKLNVISGVPFFQRLVIMIVPFLPKKFVLNIVRRGQELK
jgi:hypothetical protein